MKTAGEFIENCRTVFIKKRHCFHTIAVHLSYNPINTLIMKRIFSLFLLPLMGMNACAQANYELKANISYLGDNEPSACRKERCKLDVYYPKDKKGFKTLVWFHGGGLTAGEKEIGNELKNRGFAVVAPNYRLYPKGHNPQYTEDAAASVAWVFNHIREFGGDPSEIYVGGHSAGGYLTLMLCLDKSYLKACGIDADQVREYFPVSGQCATHYTIRTERKISFTLPVVDKYAPLNNARKLNTKLLLITGDRKLEQMARYEENLYLKAVLEGSGNKFIPIHEMSGFDHNSVLVPACELISNHILKGK